MSDLVIITRNGVKGGGGMHGKAGMCGEGVMHDEGDMYGEGGMCGKGGMCGEGGVHSQGGHARQRGAYPMKGACVVEGRYTWGLGVHGIHAPPYEIWPVNARRYASYWNAFLFLVGLGLFQPIWSQCGTQKQ